MSILTEGAIPEGIRLDERLLEIIKTIKERLGNKLVEIVGISFAVRGGGLILLVHPSPEDAERGTLIVHYTASLGVEMGIPPNPDPELIKEVLEILEQINKEESK